MRDQAKAIAVGIVLPLLMAQAPSQYVNSSVQRTRSGFGVPWSVRADINQGLVWRKKGEYDKAIASYDAAIRRDPRVPAAYLNRGIAWQFKGDLERAIADYNAAIELDPKSADEAIRLDPTYAKAYANRAWLQATCPDATYRDGKQAAASATRACELTGWKDAAILDTLAAACAEAGEFETAVKWQNRALEGAKDTRSLTEQRARLALYEAKQPYREQPAAK
jgi:tetratricopeptide (TPR) repeat protein